MYTRAKVQYPQSQLKEVRYGRTPHVRIPTVPSRSTIDFFEQAIDSTLTPMYIYLPSNILKQLTPKCVLLRMYGEQSSGKSSFFFGNTQDNNNIGSNALDPRYISHDLRHMHLWVEISSPIFTLVKYLFFSILVLFTFIFFKNYKYNIHTLVKTLSGFQILDVLDIILYSKELLNRATRGILSRDNVATINPHATSQSLLT
ncbi:hypothetical protein ACJX0J_037645, partial [Zea mays]